MNWKEKLQAAWKNRKEIVEGFGTLLLSHDKDIREELERRKDICMSNLCGNLDEKGEGDNVFIKGEPACGLCGCNIAGKTACMSCTCTLRDIGKMPLWAAFLTPEQEKEVDEMNKQKPTE